VSIIHFIHVQGFLFHIFIFVLINVSEWIKSIFLSHNIIEMGWLRARLLDLSYIHIDKPKKGRV